jgi:hypothetical protein
MLLKVLVMPMRMKETLLQTRKAQRQTRSKPMSLSVSADNRDRAVGSANQAMQRTREKI